MHTGSSCYCLQGSWSVPQAGCATGRLSGFIPEAHTAQCGLAGTEVPSQDRCMVATRGRPPRTALGARPHSCAMRRLHFSGNPDATHTFPFFVDRLDESRSSEAADLPAAGIWKAPAAAGEHGAQWGWQAMAG